MWGFDFQPFGQILLIAATTHHAGRPINGVASPQIASHKAQVKQRYLRSATRELMMTWPDKSNS